MNRPRIISVSGIDGSGKSTQLQNLKEYYELQNKKVEILKVKYTPYHKYKCDSLNTDLLRSIMALEFVKYYNEKFQELCDYDYLLCDRSKACLLAYGLTYGLQKVENIYKILELTPNPDILFYFDMDPTTSLERIKNGRGKVEEDENLENLKQDKINYTKIFSKYNFNPVCIDANNSKDNVLKKLIYSIDKNFN